MSTDLDRVRHEVIDVHVFISEWIAGGCSKDEATYKKGFVNRLSPSFMIVMPGGRTFAGGDFMRMMYESHGSNPSFRIRDHRHRPAPADR